MYARTGRLPQSVAWWQQSLKYLQYLTTLNDDRLVHRAYTADCVQQLGWHGLPPRLVPLPPLGAQFGPEVGCEALATAAETALLSPNPDSMARLYYSFKEGLKMEPFLYKLHRGPLRTTLARQAGPTLAAHQTAPIPTGPTRRFAVSILLSIHPALGGTFRGACAFPLSIVCRYSTSTALGCYRGMQHPGIFFLFFLGGGGNLSS